MTRAGNPDPNKYKWCVTGQHFELKSGFGLNRTKSDGLQGSCRAHNNERGREHWLSRRESRTGWPADAYAEAFEEQGGVCAVCGSANNGRALCADHDHRTGKLRKLLCDSCNMAIGQVKDDPQRLRDLADYVEGFRS